MLLLFVRVDGSRLPVEVPIDGRVRDLYEEVRKLGYAQCVLSHGGDDLSSLDVELSETGLSAQSAVDLRVRGKLNPLKLRGRRLTMSAKADGARQRSQTSPFKHSTTALDLSGRYFVYFEAPRNLRALELDTGGEAVCKLDTAAQVTSVAVSASGAVYFVQECRVMRTDLQLSEPELVCKEELSRVLCSADGDDWLVSRNQKLRPLHSPQQDWLPLDITDETAKGVRGCAALIGRRVALAVNQHNRVDVFCCTTGDCLFKVANLYYPQDVACDGFGGVVIADGANRRIFFAGDDAVECRIGHWPWSIAMRGQTLIVGTQASFITLAEGDEERRRDEPAFTI